MSSHVSEDDEASITQSLGEVTIVSPSSSKTTVARREVDTAQPSKSTVSTPGPGKRKQRSDDSLVEPEGSEKGKNSPIGKDVKIRKRIVVATSTNKPKNNDTTQSSRDSSATQIPILNNGANKGLQSERDGVKTHGKGIVANKGKGKASKHVKSLKDYFTFKTASSSDVPRAVVSKPNVTQSIQPKQNKMIDQNEDTEMFDVDGVLPLSEDGNALFRRMAKTKDKLLRFELHLEYMTKYQEADVLPKGLRIIKEPYFGEPLEDFDDQWKEVLTAASKRLLDITIEKLKFLTANLTQAWADLESDLDTLEAPEHIKIAMIEKVLGWAARKEPKLRETKNAKWERDLKYKPTSMKRGPPSHQDHTLNKRKKDQAQVRQQKPQKGRGGNQTKQQKQSQKQGGRPNQKSQDGKNWGKFKIPKRGKKSPKSDKEGDNEAAFRQMMMKFFSSFMK